MEVLEKTVSNDVLFAQKVYLVVQLLGGQSDILATIGSWRQEVDDQTTFDCLDAWIEAKIEEQQQSLYHAIKLHKK